MRDAGHVLRRCFLAAALAPVCGGMPGCKVDSFFNPSVIGYWEHTPTTIPILERLDVIEAEQDGWGQTTDPLPEDLVPSDLTYRTAPGDVMTISIYEIQQAGQWTIVQRRVGADGFVRVPELGEIQAAGRTPQELKDALVEILRAFLTRPQVDVVLEQQGAFSYTVYGFISRPGLYTIINSDLRLLDALASAGGVPQQIDTLYVIRQVSLSDEVRPAYERGTVPQTPTTEPGAPKPIDIDDLIEGMDDQPGDQPNEGGAGGAPGVRPGVFGPQDDPAEPPIDIDDLMPDPAQPVQDTEAAQPPIVRPPVVDIDDLRGTGEGEGAWIYVEERGEWIRVDREGEGPGAAAGGVPGAGPLFLERVIKIPTGPLLRGESRYNIVVRPKDRIFLEPPPTGVIYVDGFIVRPGTFNLPPEGITLSRLVAAAGGLSQLAIPERVDLVRMVGPNREAAIRLNLGAIRARTEPDVLLKPNDHIIIGTNWFATPLAVVRSGFRATYGFGFLLDRNFGNDVFGAPPSNVGR